MRLPVYVIHWNAPEWCAETVASLLASDGVGVEVTVIDNASRKLPQLPREVTLEKLPKNVGFSGGANQALRLHRARAEREEFFCIVCHDLHVEAAALRTCLEIARAYPGYGILGLNGTDLPEREGPIIDHDWVSGTCLFLRRDCADDVGWFDEIYGSYVEDIDFSYRAARKGWKLGIVTAARASAHGSVDSRRAIILTRANHTLLAAKQGDYGLAFSRLAGMAWRTLTMRGDLWPASFVQTARHLGRWMFRGGGHHGSRAITFPSRVTIDRFWVASQVLRFVPSGLGAHALARMTLASAARSPIRRRQTLHGGARFELDLSDRAQAQTYVIRRYEPDVSRFIAKKARRGGVFFDVGANIGLISFSVAVRRPDLSIHAFEADPANAERWRRNLELNLGVTAQLEEKAVGATDGELTLVRGEESGWSFVVGRDHEGGIAVPVTTLDRHAAVHGINRIDFLKIDVEGYEAHVLEGATTLLERAAIDFILCELDESLLRRSGTSRSSVVALLRKYGYTPRTIPGVGAQRARRRSWKASNNVLFTPQSPIAGRPQTTARSREPSDQP